jgi:hypothetical protein
MSEKRRAARSPGARDTTVAPSHTARTATMALEKISGQSKGCPAADAA